MLMLTLKLLHSVCWYIRCVATPCSQLWRTSELVGHMQKILGQRYGRYLTSNAAVHVVRLAGTINTTGQLLICTHDTNVPDITTNV